MALIEERYLNSYAADGEKLRAKQTTAVEGLTVALGQTHELTEDETMDVDSTDYFGKITTPPMQKGVYIRNGKQVIVK